MEDTLDQSANLLIAGRITYAFLENVLARRLRGKTDYCPGCWMPEVKVLNPALKRFGKPGQAFCFSLLLKSFGYLHGFAFSQNFRADML